MGKRGGEKMKKNIQLIPAIWFGVLCGSLVERGEYRIAIIVFIGAMVMSIAYEYKIILIKNGDIK